MSFILVARCLCLPVRIMVVAYICKLIVSTSNHKVPSQSVAVPSFFKTETPICTAVKETWTIFPWKQLPSFIFMVFLFSYEFIGTKDVICFHKRLPIMVSVLNRN